MHLHEMSERKCDGHGCGHFGASRGTRKHQGIDLNCKPMTTVCSPVAGTVTKIGYPYGDDLSYRYVEISSQGYAFRVFYVDPMVTRGQQVSKSTPIGKAQDLGTRYSGITNHVHLEIKNAAGEFIDPTPVVLAQRA
ncbi:M23 family metallopeptidase [Marinobacter shengliensis]|uniref:M23 family metallopeptidase n=1 Tax=Marinobacter shengliensis TaxID=1389223 RepID=UPI0011090AA6|nr:M23 family metallopeptidase [Marinobacter shengliensis]